MLTAIVRAMLRQRLLVVVISIALCLAGMFAAKNLSVDAFPDVTNIQVQVATAAIGRSPEEIERLITVPVEIAMTGLPGLVEMRSMNKSGLSLITLVFTDKTDVFFARQLVMERLISVSGTLLPGIEPVLGPVSTGLGEVYQYTLENPDDGKRALTVEELTERRTIQDWVVRPMLRSIQGVAEVNSIGGHVKEYQVYVDPSRLRHYDVTLAEIDRALANNNANASGNILPLPAEQYLIRSVGLIHTLDDIRNIVLRETNGIPVYVRDVAEVMFGGEVRQGASIKDGYTESVTGIVMMLRGGNAKDIVGRIKEKVAEINERQLLPDGLQIVPFYDRTIMVDAALESVYKVLIEALIFVIVVMVVCLGNFRVSLVVCATLVITPLVTFMIMNYLGIPANLMSLGGLTIAIGLMVDPTVVVVENIFLRLSHAHGTGESKLETISKAAAEVGAPVIYGIVIIVLVFLPLMSLEGMEGKMFSPLAITISIALLVALVVSVLLSPVLCDYALKEGESEEDTKIVAILKTLYLRLLNLALMNPRGTALVSVGSLLLAIALYPMLGKSFIPIMKEGSVTPVIIRSPSISLDEAIKLETEAMKLIAAVPGVTTVVSKLGRGESPADPASQNESDPIVMLDLEKSGRTQLEIEEDIRKALTVIPGVNIALSQPIAQRVDEMVTGVRSQVAIKIFGDDLVELRKLSEQVARIVKSTRGARDIRIERLSGQQELTINIDRQAIARYGINVTDVNELIATAIGGKAVTQVFEGERRYTLLLRFPEEFRDDVESIHDLLLRPAVSLRASNETEQGGMLIPLKAVAEIKVIDGPAIISRENVKRRVVVGANVHERDIAGFVKELQERTAKEVKLPPGYYFVWGGQFENMERAMETLSVIVPITFSAIFFLLFMLFGSVKLAALIFTALPFASVGGVIGLFLTGEYLSVPASVGFIAVWGVAILNGVVLISFIKELREQGLSVADAVKTSCEARFRPVLITAAATILGLAPFLIATGLGSEVQKPLAIVVICGLITATVMTKVVVPMLYRWFDDMPDESPKPNQLENKHINLPPV